MALRPISKQSVPDQVFDQVLTDVVEGELGVGDALPSERRLAEVLGVSRPAVREALQRIAHTGVVEVRQGGATTVRDFTRHAGLDLLPRLLVRGGRLDAAVARSVVEARTQIGPSIAAQAAERNGPTVGAALDAVLEKLTETDDAATWQELALEFWDAIVDGADSIVYRLMFNSLRAAYAPAIPALADLLTHEVGTIEPYRVLAAAIGAGDPGTARAAAERVLGPTADSLLAAFTSLEGQEAGR